MAAGEPKQRCKLIALAVILLIWDKETHLSPAQNSKMKRLLAALILTLLAAPAYAHDYETGLAAFKLGDYVTALDAWRTAAEMGDARAQNNLAGMYDAGVGVPQDASEAVRWYRRAADQGLEWAQLNLAHMYRRGLGVPQDYGEAVRWYRTAAESGFVFAQTNLGWMYLNGLGVAPDDRAAAQWFQKAAEQGDVEAQNNLGVMYATGRGVPHDDVQAYVWFKVAAAQGYKGAAQNRDLAAAQLSPAQLRDADRIAVEK